MVAKGDRIDGHTPLGLQHAGEALRPCDSAECQRQRRQRHLASLAEAESSPDDPNRLRASFSRESPDYGLQCKHFVLTQHEDVGLAHSRERFAQVPGRQQVVFDVLAGEQNDIDVARELAVLEAVVKQIHGDLAVLLVLFGEQARAITVGSGKDRHAGALRHQHRLVAVKAGIVVGLDALDQLRGALVAPREDPDRVAAPPQNIGQQQHHRGLARSPRRHAAHADHRAGQAVLLQPAAPEHHLLDRQSCSIQWCKGQQDWPANAH